MIADDDVRYSAAALAGVIDRIDGADLVRPQNYFDPRPWHARWDTGRTLINRSFSGDYPGTLVVRRSAFLAVGGYDGDVLFENLELMRTIGAAGGRIVNAPDVFVRRIPPSTRHFLSQRVRQAYDDLTLPGRLALELAVVPAVVALLALGRRRAVLGLVAVVIGVAERGRRRHGGRGVFPPSASLFAPLWTAERGVCVWAAVSLRVFRGGVSYGGARVAKPANRRRDLRHRLGGRLSGSVPAAVGSSIGADRPQEETKWLTPFSKMQ